MSGDSDPRAYPREPHRRPRGEVMARAWMRGLVGAIIVVTVLAGLPPARAHVDPIDPDVGHAIIADPLFDFNDPDGVLFGVKVDDPTQMASTTKSFTLFLAVIALEDGTVHATDEVVVGPNAVLGSPWVPQCSSLMNGSGCQPNTTIYCCNPQASLQVGEKVQFWDLLHGMMYPSGNDAAVAVGEHVIQGYVGPSGDVTDFVSRMNFAAFFMGLTHTHFTNPAGLDGDPSGNGGVHQTTPREQAFWW